MEKKKVFCVYTIVDINTKFLTVFVAFQESSPKWTDVVPPVLHINIKIKESKSMQMFDREAEKKI